MMSSNDIINTLERTSAVKFSDEQRDILNTTGGICILASAGSGKTSTIINLIAKRLLSGEIHDPSKLLCTTFSKGGAGEMQVRLLNLLGKLGYKQSSSISIKTQHSVYYKLLKEFGYSINIAEPFALRKYLIDSCKSLKISIEDDDDFKTLESILGYQVNNILTDKDTYDSCVFTLRDSITLVEYMNLRQSIYAKKQLDGVMDFDDLQLMFYTLLRSQYREQAIEYCKYIWNYIYVDEAQDISKIQFEILRDIIGDPSKTVFIGDDDQAIYSWRGSDPSILLNICGIYPEITLKNLTTNYRCKSNIVDKASNGILYNSIRCDKVMKASEQGGNIQFIDDGGGDIYDRSLKAADYIQDLIISGKEKEGNLAVLCRNNLPIVLLNNLLFSRGLLVDSASDVKFTTNSMFLFLDGIIQLLYKQDDSSVVSDNLWKVVPFLSKKNSADIGKIQSSYNLSFLDTMRLLLLEIGGVHKQESDVYDLSHIKLTPIAKTTYSTLYNRFSSSTREGLIHIYRLLSDNSIDNSQKLRSLYNAMYVGCGRKLFNSRFLDMMLRGFTRYLIDLVNTKGYVEYTRYINNTAMFERGGFTVSTPRITVSTMHNAKGREWGTVMIFMDDNTILPNFQHINTYIEDNIPQQDINRYIQEDRRLHYVAMTRAKNNLVILCNRANPSVYLLESFGVIKNKGIENDAVIQQAAKKACSVNYTQYLQKEVLRITDQLFFGITPPEDGVEGAGDSVGDSVEGSTDADKGADTDG